MVERMSDFRKHKGLFFFVTAIVLLSFFCSVQSATDGGWQPKGTDWGHLSSNAKEMSSDAVAVLKVWHSALTEHGDGTGLTAPAEFKVQDQGLPMGRTCFSLARMMLAVLLLFVLCVITACRIAVRRFGTRMILLWENIFYIHQKDGEKGNAILYT